MSLRRKRSRAAVALATVALAGVLLVTTGTGSTSRSWTWEVGVPGAPTAGAGSPERILVDEGDLALLAAPQGGAIAVGTSEGELTPLTDLAGDEPLVVFAAAAPEGGPQRLVGVARSDVQQVEAVLRDGTTQELSLNEWRAFSYLAPTPGETALGLVARSGDSEIGVVRVPQTSTTLGPTAGPSCDPAAGPCPQATAAGGKGEQTYALFEHPGSTLLTRIDQRTLVPVGRGLTLDGYRYGPARSPDGTRIAIAASDRAAVDLIDLGRMQRVASLALDWGGRTTVRALAWLREDRLVAVVQRMSVPTARYVRSRELVVVDPPARRIVARTPITNKLALNGVASAGGRLVLLLKPQAPRKSSSMQLLVANAEGKVRTTAVVVGRYGSALRGSALVVEPSGRRAFVLLWAVGLDEGRAVEVDLSTMRPVTRSLQLAGGMRITEAGVSLLQAVAAGEGHVAATDVVPGHDGRPAGGVFLIDTRTWVARLLDGRARGLAYDDGRVYTFGADNRVSVTPGGHVTRPQGGLGVTAYDLDGRRLYHSYGERSFVRLLFAGQFGHGLPQGSGAGVAFDAASGQGVGKLAPLNPFRIELVPEASQGAKRSTSGSTAQQQAATMSYTISNRGRLVVPRPLGRSLFGDHPFRLYLLATRNDRAYYRVQVTDRFTCWAAGKAARIGEIGLMGCPGLVGAYPLQLEDSAFRARRVLPGSHPARSPMIRAGGIAVDQAAAVALVDASGRQVELAPVIDNVFSFHGPFPKGGFLRLVVLDGQGAKLEPRLRQAEHQTPPPGIFGPRATRVNPSRLGMVVQRGSSEGVTLSVGRTATVVFDGHPASGATRDALERSVGFHCFVVTGRNVRKTRDIWFQSVWKPPVAYRLIGIEPPFDGCDIQGTYGHRWRDQYGTHSLIEIPLTQRGRLYFEDRSTARDLALFVRSRTTRELRKLTGTRLIAALRKAYGDRITVLPSGTTKPPLGQVGVHTNGSRAIFSERSSTGDRLYVELDNGKIVGQNLRRLAMVY